MAGRACGSFEACHSNLNINGAGVVYRHDMEPGAVLGEVVAVRGAVVDVGFARGILSPIDLAQASALREAAEIIELTGRRPEVRVELSVSCGSN